MEALNKLLEYMADDEKDYEIQGKPKGHIWEAVMKIRNTLRGKKPPKLYILFQTDQWKTKASRVCFGAYSSFNKANQAAKDNDLYSHESEVVIIEVALDKFEEIK